MTYIKVKDKDYLERDVYSNGIVNNDVDGYNKYLETYKRTYTSQQRIQCLEDDMKCIRDDMNEIKNLLKALANGPEQYYSRKYE